MANFFKNLKIANGKAKQVLTTDENGMLVSSEKNVDDLVTKEITDALATRVSSLEEVTTDMGERLKQING